MNQSSQDITTQKSSNGFNPQTQPETLIQVIRKESTFIFKYRKNPYYVPPPISSQTSPNLEVETSNDLNQMSDYEGQIPNNYEINRNSTQFTNNDDQSDNDFYDNNSITTMQIDTSTAKILNNGPLEYNPDLPNKEQKLKDSQVMQNQPPTATSTNSQQRTLQELINIMPSIEDISQQCKQQQQLKIQAKANSTQSASTANAANGGKGRKRGRTVRFDQPLLGKVRQRNGDASDDEEPDEIEMLIRRLHTDILNDARNDPVEQAKKIRQARESQSDQTNSTTQLSVYERMILGSASQQSTDHQPGEFSNMFRTLEDEQIEINQNFLFDEYDSEDDSIADDKVEIASDDEQMLLQEHKKRGKKYLQDEIVKEEDFDEDDDSDEDIHMDDLENESLSFDRNNRKSHKPVCKRTREENILDADLGDEKDDEDTIFIDNLPSDEFSIRRQLQDVKSYIKQFEMLFFEEEDSDKEEQLKQITNVQKHEEALQNFKDRSHLKNFWCIPLSSDVREIDWDVLIARQQEHTNGQLFDVITCDPPWQLSSANPTRGVAIAYETLNDGEILKIPWGRLQKDGFLFIWVINAKYRFALDMMGAHGYRVVDEIQWVKQTCNGKIAKGHGYYLQHAKEVCLVGCKGDPAILAKKCRSNIESDVIFSERRGQSQKPEEIYELVEALVPNGYYMEIFGRRNNLHNGWVTVGNEL
eukprot:403376498